MIMQFIYNSKLFKRVTVRSPTLALPLVKLVLKFDPMQSEIMQKAFHYIHEHKHENCCCCEDWKRKAKTNY